MRRIVRGQVLFTKDDDAEWLDHGVFRQVLATAHDISPDLIVHYAKNLFIIPMSPLAEWRVFDSQVRSFVDWIYYGDKENGVYDEKISEVLGYLRSAFNPSRVDCDDDVILFPNKADLG